jgi:uncharacterized membrane-anchored protein
MSSPLGDRADHSPDHEPPPPATMGLAEIVPATEVRPARRPARDRLRRRNGVPDGPLTGVARVDRRTKRLVKRLQPGDIAVINHEDLDRVAAETLVDAAPMAVVNAAPSITGRYPNLGPLMLCQAGIPLVDDVGPVVMEAIHEGAPITVDGDRVLVGTEVIATGVRQDTATVDAAIDDARANMGPELERFAVNTVDYVRQEIELLTGDLDVPDVRCDIEGRHVLIVVRGIDYKEDLSLLQQSGYLRGERPVVIGVDGGADALLEVGAVPDMIIGDFDSVSENALATGAELIHHVHLDGRAPGREALQAWGVPYHEFVVDGTSEDVAMLLAYEAGAQLIVAVGTHASMVEFLDKGRSGMSSTFLTRLRLGPALVDAKGVNRLYEGRVRRRDIALLVGSAIVAMIVVSIVSEPIHVFLRGIELTLRDLWFSITDTF